MHGFILFSGIFNDVKNTAIIGTATKVIIFAANLFFATTLTKGKSYDFRKFCHSYAIKIKRTLQKIQVSF